MEIFNNREIAIAIWLTAFIASSLFSKDVRLSFASLIDTLTTKTILIPFSLLIVHTIASIWLLNHIGLWEVYQTKTALFWFVSVAAVSFFRINKIADDQDYFRNAIFDSLRIVVLLEFIVNFYTFNLLLELILVPLATFLSILPAFPQQSNKHPAAVNLANQLLGAFGIAIIGHTIYRLITTFDEFARMQTFYDFIVPIALSFLLLPFIYALHLYMSYERIFFRIQCSVKDPILRKYAKRKAIIKYNINLPALRWWADTLSYNDMNSTSDIDETFREIDRIRKEEKNPPSVPVQLGWSPYDATTILAGDGLKTNHYKKLYENEWFASSPYLEIGDGIVPNNIAYYLDGNRQAVTRLKLVMNINDPEAPKATHEKLSELASKLHLYAIGKDLSNNIKNAILHSQNYKSSTNSKMVIVAINHWPSRKGYSVAFSIENLS